MKKIYVIEGNTGEYSDRVNWLFAAYLNEEKAKERVEFLNAELMRLGLYSNVYDRNVAAVKAMQKHDEQFLCDYTGSYYALLNVDLFDEADEKSE